MCPVVAAAFDLMDAAARADGGHLVVTSGFRSDAEQAVLFARHPDPKWVAPPGRSRHRDATELDLNMAGGGAAHAWLAANGGRFGFVQRYSWEPWHWGYPGLRRGRRGGGGAGGPRGGRCPPGVGARAPARPDRVLGDRERPRARAARGPAAGRSGFDPRAAGHRAVHARHGGRTRAAGPVRPRPGDPGGGSLLAGHVRCFGSVPWRWRPTTPGRKAVRRYGGVPPYPETQAYVARILAGRQARAS